MFTVLKCHICDKARLWASVDFEHYINDKVTQRFEIFTIASTKHIVILGYCIHAGADPAILNSGVCVAKAHDFDNTHFNGVYFGGSAMCSVYYLNGLIATAPTCTHNKILVK